MTRELRKKFRDMLDAMKRGQVIIVKDEKRIELCDVNAQEMKISVKDLDAKCTSKYWIDDIEFIKQLVLPPMPELMPRMRRPKPAPPSQPIVRQPKPVPPPSAPLPPLQPKPPSTPNTIWCYYCAANRVPDVDGKCSVCGLRLVYQWVSSPLYKKNV